MSEGPRLNKVPRLNNFGCDLAALPWQFAMIFSLPSRQMSRSKLSPPWYLPPQICAAGVEARSVSKLKLYVRRSPPTIAHGVGHFWSSDGETDPRRPFPESELIPHVQVESEAAEEISLSL
jgi:hypothetical protein